MWPFGINNKYPYTDFHELNTDYLIEKTGKIDQNLQDSETAREGAETAQEAAETAQAAAETAQEGAETAEDNTEEYYNNLVTHIADDVTDWLNDNVNPVGAAVVVDSSLTISGAAADAEVTGNELTDLKSDLYQAIGQSMGEKLIPALIYGSISGSTGYMSPGTSGSYPEYISTSRIRIYCIRNLRYIKVNDPDIQAILYYYTSNDTDLTYLGQYPTTFIHNDYIFPDKYNHDFVSVVFTKGDNNTITMDDIRANVEIYADSLNWAINTSINSQEKYYQTNNSYTYSRMATHFIDTDIYSGIYLNLTIPFLLYYYDENFNFVYRESASFTTGTGVVNFKKYKYAVVCFNISDTNRANLINNTYLIKQIYSDTLNVLQGTAYNYTGRAINILYPAELNLPSYSSNQDGAIYGDYLIRLTSTGTIYIINVLTGVLVDSCSVTDNIPHANSVFFGDKFDNTDPYPIFYANYYNNTPAEAGVLFGYRLHYVDGVLTATLIKTIKIGFTSSSIWTTGNDNRPFGNFMYDGTYLYAYTTLDEPVNVTRFFKFVMPDNSTLLTTLAQSDIVEYFDVDKMAYPQGCQINNNLAYCSYGWTGNIDIIDLSAKETISKINFTGTDLNGEPELITFYNGNLIYGTANNIYLVKF